MSDSTSSRRPANATDDLSEERRGTTRQAAAARLVPAVRFGLRTAVLAGVIATVGGATAGLNGSINALAGPVDTTCCGNPSIVASQSL
ncbi:MAG TPA: hypothetical protein VH372_11620 [Actinospica sp.]|nr:hypothetical protein [Actinospica sp.]